MHVCVCVCVCIMSRQQLFLHFFFISISLGDDDARQYPHTYTLSHTQKHALQEEYVGFLCKIRIGTLRITQLRGVQSRFLSIKKQHVV